MNLQFMKEAQKVGIWDSWRTTLKVEVYYRLTYVNRVHRNISTLLINTKIMGVKWIEEIDFVL